MENEKREFIIKKLKEKGFRITRQRRMLLDVILANECSSCKEIFFEASRRDNWIGTATVYRMVNLLEEIGAIDRKNMYKISYPNNCSLEEACIVELSDDSTCRLSAKRWNEVLHAGLEACGYLQGREVTGIILHPCSCEQEGLGHAV